MKVLVKLIFLNLLFYEKVQDASNTVESSLFVGD